MPIDAPSESAPTAMPAGVVALLERSLDFAGLFPPAALDMEATVAAYARGLTGSSAWLVERLVVPTGRLDEFETAAAALLPRTEDGDPWPISALVASADDRVALRQDFERISRFNTRHCDATQGLAIVDIVELRGDEASAIDAALDLVPAEIFPFFELPWNRDPRGLVTALVGGDGGAKIRTGGVTSDLYPTPVALARFVHACAAVDVAFKATAGLHHPWRHQSTVLGCAEFGFLNLFAAGVLARARRLDEAALERVLTETGPGALRFDEDGLTWDGERVTTEEIEDARLTFAISFGSCSFDEPAADLRAFAV